MGRGEALFAIGVVGDVRPAFPFCGHLATGVAAIAFVSERGRADGHGLRQSLSLTCVVDLPARQPQGDGATVSVHHGVDLAREAAAGTPHAMIAGSLFPVAPCWWTRTQVEPIFRTSSRKRGNCGQKPASDAGLPPANETIVASRRRSIAGTSDQGGGTCLETPEDPAKYSSIIDLGHATRVVRQPKLSDRLLLIRQFIAPPRNSAYLKWENLN